MTISNKTFDKLFARKPDAYWRASVNLAAEHARLHRIFAAHSIRIEDELDQWFDWLDGKSFCHLDGSPTTTYASPRSWRQSFGKGCMFEPVGYSTNEAIDISIDAYLARLGYPAVKADYPRLRNEPYRCGMCEARWLQSGPGGTCPSCKSDEIEPVRDARPEVKAPYERPQGAVRCEDTMSDDAITARLEAAGAFASGSNPHDDRTVTIGRLKSVAASLFVGCDTACFKDLYVAGHGDQYTRGVCELIGRVLLDVLNVGDSTSENAEEVAHALSTMDAHS